MRWYPLLSLGGVILWSVTTAAICSGTERPVTYVNSTQFQLRVTIDGDFLTMLEPGQREVFLARNTLFPDRMQAYNGDELIHDHLLTWEELEKGNFVYVLDGMIDSSVNSPTASGP